MVFLIHKTMKVNKISFNMKTVRFLHNLEQISAPKKYLRVSSDKPVSAPVPASNLFSVQTRHELVQSRNQVPWCSKSQKTFCKGMPDAISQF